MKRFLVIGCVLSSMFLLSVLGLHAQEKDVEDSRSCELGGTPALVQAEKVVQGGLEAEGEKRAHLLQQGLKQARQQQEQARPEALWVQSRALLGLDSIQAGSQALQEFEALKPECRQIAQSLREQKWAEVYNRGVHALKVNNQHGAQKHFVLASQLHPDPRSVINAGVLSLQLGALDQAEKWFKEAQDITGGKHFQKASQGLAQVYIHRGQQKRALEVYRGMIKHAASVEEESWLDYGRLLANVGRPQKAREAYQKAGQAESQQTIALQAANALLALSDPKAHQAAIGIYQRLYQQRPFSPEVSIGLFKSLLQEGQFQEAVQLGNTLLEAYPLHGQLYTLQAQGLDRLDRANQVEQLLSRKQALPAQITQLQLGQTQTEEWQVRGQLKGARSIQKLHLELVDQQGNTLAQQTIEIQLSAAPTKFEATFGAYENVGGVRYSVANQSG